MRKQQILVLLVILAAGLCLTAYAQKNSAGAKPTSGVASCRLLFSSYDPQVSSTDTTVGGFTGDNTDGWYVNKDKGLRCEMDTGTNNFFFDLNYFKYSGLRRQAWINLNFPTSGNESDELGIQLTSDFFHSSGNLWNMRVGDTVTTGGEIMIPINGKYYALFLGAGNGGTGVQATRTSSSQWVLYAPQGSIGQLKMQGRGNAWDPVGFYYFGFTITIELVP